MRIIRKRMRMIQKFFAVFAFFFASFALYSTASAYILLQKLPSPGGQLIEEITLADYLSWLFRFALAAAAFLAVVQIVIGGIQMMIGGASETQRSSAKSRIQDAIYGLLLALASWLILYTINPNLAQMKLTIPEVTIKALTTAVPPTGGECQNCLPLTQQISSNFIKPTACSGGISNCQLSQNVISRLMALGAEAAGLGVSNWWITEAYPPTVTHKDPCHNNGTCVDIAFKGGANCDNVKKLIQAAQKSGFSVTNEYAGCDGKTYDTTTGNCLHIK